jgi:hypothetical protein
MRWGDVVLVAVVSTLAALLVEKLKGQRVQLQQEGKRVGQLALAPAPTKHTP